MRTFFWIEHYYNKVQVCVPRIHSPQRFQLSSFEVISGLVALLERNYFLSVFVTKSNGVGLKTWGFMGPAQDSKSFQRSLKSIQPSWIKQLQRQESYQKVQNNLGNPKWQTPWKFNVYLQDSLQIFEENIRFWVTQWIKLWSCLLGIFLLKLKLTVTEKAQLHLQQWVPPTTRKYLCA